jgi:cellulose synthase/poly-beta-1,6-N-acetylglucosamine synthase-like glycosyltransferase
MNSTYEPSVSVVVPAYNAEATIDECVRSLLELRYPREKLELLVVDNESRDGTAKALRRYRDDRIALLGERKRGAAAARNAGLAHSGGEVVAFTDADCAVDPDWLRHLVVPAQYPGVGIAGGTILAGPSATDVERFGEEIHDHRRAIEVYRPPYAITMSWASRRELLRELGGFDERFSRCQDVDLSFRVVQAGYALAFVPEAVVYHRNEDSLPGLFREGFVHGFHGVHARKRHEDFLRRYGHGRFNSRGYAAIGSRLCDWARGRDTPRSGCDAVFNVGKKAGKLLGSLRFGHLDL